MTRDYTVAVWDHTHKVWESIPLTIEEAIQDFDALVGQFKKDQDTGYTLVVRYCGGQVVAWQEIDHTKKAD